MSPLRLAVLLTLACVSAFAADVPTQMTVRGKELYSEDFAKPLPRYTGKFNGHTSGFTGWQIFSPGREPGDRLRQGYENPQVKEPLTASYGIQYQNIILQCQVRLEDGELDIDPPRGPGKRFFQLRATNDKSHLCSLVVYGGGFLVLMDDNDRDGPNKLQVLATHKKALAIGQWHTVLIEIMGDEFVATVDGHTIAGQHPAIAQLKHSFEFVLGHEGSVRDLHLWEARPNADWPMTRAVIAAANNPVAPGKK